MRQLPEVRKCETPLMARFMILHWARTPLDSPAMMKHLKQAISRL